MESATPQPRQQQHLRWKKTVTVQRLSLFMTGLLTLSHLETLLNPASASRFRASDLGEELRHHSSSQQRPGPQSDVPPYQGHEVHSLLESPSLGDPRAVLRDLYSSITGAKSSDPFFSTWVYAFDDAHKTSAVCSTDGQPLVEGVKCEGSTVVAIDISSLDADLVAIPTSLGLLTSLTSLKLSSNLVAGGNGTLPSSLGSLTGLKELDVSKMGLVGKLPSSFSSLTGLTSLKVDKNHLVGSIPAYMNSFEALVSLEMQENAFSGPLPGFLGRLNSLTRLFVYRNNFNGKLPPELGQATSMIQFKAHWNSFKKSLPKSYGDFVNATHIDLRGTGVSGKIPSSWGNLKSMQNLHLEHNFLRGSIPSSFCQMTSLHEIYLNNNTLNGTMPACWTSFEELRTIVVDDAVICPAGRVQTCCGGDPYEQRFCSANLCCKACCRTCYYDTGSKSWSIGFVIGVIVGGLVVAVLLVCLLVKHCYPRLVKRQVSSESAIKTTSSAANTEPSLTCRRPSYWSWERHKLEDWEKNIDYAFRRYSLAEVLLATENFSMDRVIGKGGFGVVYVGKGPRDETWAVKRAKAVERKSSKSSAFEDEVRTVHKLRHKNLVQLLGYCNEGMEQVLVYEYMALGALSKHLYDEHKDPLLDLEQRLQVAADTAEGLKYLHNFTDPPLVHRDIKPDNVLLTADLRAKVADFGLAKGIEDPKRSMFTRVAGTRGYLDPEYMSFEKVTFRCDVYSFGVVLLELITGRHATMPDPKDEDNCVHVTTWAVPIVKCGNVHLIADPRIMSEDNKPTLIGLANIAIDCVQITCGDVAHTGRFQGGSGLQMDDVCTRLEQLQRQHMAYKGLATANAGDPASTWEMLRGTKDPLTF